MKIKYFMLMMFFVVFLSNRATCGDFPLDTIFLSGPIENRVNFVFLSDGYQQNELTKFIQDVNKAADYFFTIKPLSLYKNYFNIFAISVPSKESGANHPRTAPDCPDSSSHPKLKVNNYFGSTFDANSTHRLLVVTRIDSVIKVLLRNFPSYDQAFVLVNSPFYGGAGGTFATSSTNHAASEIIMHEFTHSFARVSDEYGGDCTYTSLIGPNVTQQKTFNLIPWNYWIDQSTTLPTPQTSQYASTPGLFEGAYYCNNGWFRPQLNCKMRSLGVPYCVVCTQAIIEKIHELTNPLEEYFPKAQNLNVFDSMMVFTLKTIKPIPNTLLISWSIDSVNTAFGDTLILYTKKMQTKFYRITATVNDTTPLTRDPNHSLKHIKAVQWIMNKMTSGINLETETIGVKINLYPNPFSDKINISLELEKESNIRIDLSDLSGKLVCSEFKNNLPKGNSQMTLDLSQKNLTAGSYILLLKINGTSLTKQMIKVGG